MTFISRILGFVRDMIIARIFGAGMATDAFFVAFRIPNLLRRLFAEGAFSQAFVPILAEYKNTRSAEETRDLIDHITTLLAVTLFVIMLIGIIAAPLIIYVSAPGFLNNPDKFTLTVDLLRITFPYIFFISLVALAGGILNTYGKFNIPAITPAFLNLSFIACSLWLTPYVETPILVLAWAVFIGGALQLAFQVPFLMRLKLLPRIRFNVRESGAWRVIKLMGPAVFGVSVSQISLLINTIFASLLVTGSVSWLYYADRLMEIWRQLGTDKDLELLAKELRASESMPSQAVFYMCNEMIQLMENVYLGIDLEETWHHPDNEGWRQLFISWARNESINAVWEKTGETYGERFVSFWDRNLIENKLH